MNYPAPKMKTDKDCGLTAMSWSIHKLTGRDYDDIYNDLKEIMNYKDIDLDDNPAEHQRVITTYAIKHGLDNLKFSLVEPIKENLFSGRCPDDCTIILVKLPNEQTGCDFIDDLLSTLTQHWIVLNSVDIENRMVDVWLGNGNLYRMSFEKLEKWIIGGLLPNCVYVIGDYTPIENPWYSKLYMRLINFIARLFD